MEFNEKLQELRKQKGLTQEELSAILFVSRAAVSKWESGRGYPNIDSLKAIAGFYHITIDELLSSDELLTIAEADNKQKEKHNRHLLFALLDLCATTLLFMPLFGQTVKGEIKALPLYALDSIGLYLKLSYFTVIIAMITLGCLSFGFRFCNKDFGERNHLKLSLLINAAGVLLFTASQQPYAATFLFVFLSIKAITLIKWQ